MLGSLTDCVTTRTSSTANGSGMNPIRLDTVSKWSQMAYSNKQCTFQLQSRKTRLSLSPPAKITFPMLDTIDAQVCSSHLKLCGLDQLWT